MNEKNEKHELRIEMQQNPNSQILQDLENLRGQSKETLNASMTDNHGKNWREEVEKAKQANVNK